MNDRSMIDYLVIGHVSQDITPDGPAAGGTVAYSSRVAQALGCRTAVVTSAAPDFKLDGIFPNIEVFKVPSEKTTTFINEYSSSGRRQRIKAVASGIGSRHIPVEWQRAKIVHLGPIANELNPDLISLFSNSLIGITPQGWFRRWNEDGWVYTQDWPQAQDVLKLAGAVIISEEDVPNLETICWLRKWCSLVVLTQQSGGCLVYCRDEARHFDAPSVKEVNPTGAGDTFATSFLIRLHQTRGNPWEAAVFANRVAAASVTENSLDEKIKAVSRYSLDSISESESQGCS